MKEKLLAGVLALAVSAPIVAGAEQPAAENYRQLFHSGNFLVEYKDNYTVRLIGEKDGKRMERTRYESSMAWMQMLNPLGMLFGGSSPKHPEVLHKDGKYYQFLEKNRAVVLEDDRLNEENLDPRQGWSSIAQKLALPIELAVFYWDDPYRTKITTLEKPVLTWSGKKKDGGTEYDCDRYKSKIRSAAGGEEAGYMYDMLYENGELKKIESYISRGNEEYPVNILHIRKVAGELSNDLFRVGENTHLYAAGIGDMNDLLEQPEEIGTMGDIFNEEKDTANRP